MGALTHIRAPLLLRILTSFAGGLFLLLRMTIVWFGQWILLAMILQSLQIRAGKDSTGAPSGPSPIQRRLTTTRSE